MKQPKLELSLMWEARIADSSLTHCTIMLSLIITSLYECVKQTVATVVTLHDKPPLAMPAPYSGVPVESQLLCLPSSLLICLRRQQKMAQVLTWVPITQRQTWMEFLAPDFRPTPAPAVVGNWEVYQQMEYFFLSHYFTLSFQ